MTTLCSRALQFRYPLDTTTSAVRSAVKKTNLTETLIQWIRLCVARHLHTSRHAWPAVVRDARHPYTL